MIVIPPTNGPVVKYFSPTWFWSWKKIIFISTKKRKENHILIVTYYAISLTVQANYIILWLTQLQRRDNVFLLLIIGSLS